jgi:hypothetical protein
MKRLLMLAAPPLLVLALYEPTDVTAQVNCAPMNIPPVCQDTNQITINNDSNTIGPPNICVDPGETITVNVRPNGTATIQPKSGSWPTGSGASFTLQAPSSPGEYDYNVYFSDGSCIDPRIRVKG